MNAADGAAPRSVRDVNARGVRTRAVTAGNPKRPALLLVHDFLVSHLEWDEVIAPFAEEYFVVAPDLPGFGESEKPIPGRFSYTVEALSEAVVDVIAGLGIGRASIVGHGLGAAIAITIADLVAVRAWGTAITIGPLRSFWIAGPIALAGAVALIWKIVSEDDDDG